MAADNNNLMPAKPDPPEDRKKDLKQFRGVYSVKKKDDGAWAWIRRMFFSGRSLKEICMDILEHEVAPSIQDGIYNSAVSFIGKTIYRENQKPGYSGGAGSPTPGSFITNYVSYSDKKRQQTAALEANRKKDEEIVRNGFSNPAFTSLEAAKQFLGEMKAYAQKYDQLSVHELNWMQQKQVAFTWESYGWEYEEIAAIREPSRFIPPVTVDIDGQKVKLTHFIDMPKAHELKD